MFENKTKTILKQALKTKQENLVLLHLDRYHQGKVIRKLEPLDKKNEKKYTELIIRIGNEKNELEKEQLGNKDKKKIVMLEDKIIKSENEARTIKEKHKVFNEMKDECKNYDKIIIEADYLIETLEECISNPLKIYTK